MSMSRHGFRLGKRSRSSVLGRCTHKVASEKVVVIDVDNSEADVVIIEAPDTSCWATGRSRRKRISSPSSVISIDDENEGTDEGGPSNANSSKFPMASTSENVAHERFSSRNRYGEGNVSQSSYSESFGSDSSDVGSSDQEDSDSSDCEILEDTSGSIREQWEQAAARKRMSQDAQLYSEDESSLSTSSTEPGMQTDENVNNNFKDESPLKYTNLEQSEAESFRADVGTSFSCGATERPSSTMPSTELGGKQVQPEGVSSPGKMGQVVTEASCHVREKPEINFTNGNVCQDKEMPFVQEYPCFKNKPTDAVNFSNWRDLSQYVEEDHPGERIDDLHVGNIGADRSSLSTMLHEDRSLAPAGLVARSPSNNDDFPHFSNDLIGAREKQKESVEYRRIQEEEWESRQRQIQLEAEEVQKLRRRKKAQTLRVLDMERRQKQRLEEIRESERKNEETGNLKEQIRDEVRREFDQMERKCCSMASLLRGLGINVGGGQYPLPSEIRAAYKKAMFRFHPDRASTSDIRQQVRAEETFKFISRLKEKLLPVA